MHLEASTPSTSRATDSERAYFAQMSAVPRFDRDRELERARAVATTRRAYWTILLTPARLEAVLGVVADRAKDRAVGELASGLRMKLLRGGVAAVTGHGLESLLDALGRVGDEHAAADAVVALAASTDKSWHAEATRARGAYLTARNRFINANLRLVMAYAQRYGAQLLPLVDRIQEGNIGLMKAVDRFDAERGLRFSTYACWWIRHTILRALSNNGRTVRIPAQIQDLHARLERTRRRLSSELLREPEREELASALGCTLKQIDKLALTMQLHNVHSTGVPEGTDVLDTLGDDDSLAAFDHLAIDDDRERLLTALRALPEREQDILLERYGFTDDESLGTLRELGARHGLSRERVRQIQVGALAQLRRKLEPKHARLQSCR